MMKQILTLILFGALAATEFIYAQAKPVTNNAASTQKTAAEKAALDKKATMEKTAAEKQAAADKALADQKAKLENKSADAQKSAIDAADNVMSKLGFIAWGGYSLTVKNSSQSADTSSTYHGPAGGLHGYYGKALQIGLSGGYSTYGVNSAATVALIPIDLRVRYVLPGGFFIGAFTGYNVFVATPDNGGSKPSLVNTGAYIGYGFEVSESLTIAVFSDFKYLVPTDSNTSYSNVIITPGLGVNFKL